MSKYNGYDLSPTAKDISNALLAFISGKKSDKLIDKAARTFTEAIKEIRTNNPDRRLPFTFMASKTLQYNPKLRELLGGKEDSYSTLLDFYQKLSSGELVKNAIINSFNYSKSSFSYEDASKYINEHIFAGLNDTQSRKTFDEFASVFANKITFSEMKEVALWVKVAMDHSDFDPQKIIHQDSEGAVDNKKTLVNILGFCNEISLSNRNIFNIKSNFIGFYQQKRGIPDALVFDKGNIKIGFASNDRGTDIEGNQFIRHLVELASMQSYVSKNLSKGSASKVDYIDSIESYIKDNKTLSDGIIWSDNGTRLVSKSNSLLNEDLRLSVSEMIKSSTLNESDAATVYDTLSSLNNRSQMWRNLVQLRLSGLRSGAYSKDDVIERELTKKDADFIRKTVLFNSPFITSSPRKRLSSFLSSPHLLATKGHEQKIISEIKSAGENSFFGGMMKLAYGSTLSGGRIDSVKVSKESIDSLLGSVVFYADSVKVKNKDVNLAKKFIGLIFTSDNKTWERLSEELSDPVPSDISPSRSKYRGVYKEERSNYINSLKLFMRESSEAVSDGGISSVSEVCTKWFGEEYGKDVFKKVTDGCLEMITDRLYDIRLSQSEDGGKIADLESLVENLSFKVDNVENKNKKNKNERLLFS